jgi:hypothetical protein
MKPAVSTEPPLPAEPADAPALVVLSRRHEDREYAKLYKYRRWKRRAMAAHPFGMPAQLADALTQLACWEYANAVDKIIETEARLKLCLPNSDPHGGDTSSEEAPS